MSNKHISLDTGLRLSIHRAKTPGSTTQITVEQLKGNDWHQVASWGNDAGKAASWLVKSAFASDHRHALALIQD